MRRLGAARHRANRAPHRFVPVDSRPVIFEVIPIMSKPFFHHAQYPHTHDGDPTSAGSFNQRPSPKRRDYAGRSFTVGIGGPVGSGKTALLLALCRTLRDTHQLGVVTNDIFTKEDAE